MSARDDLQTLHTASGVLELVSQSLHGIEINTDCRKEVAQTRVHEAIQRIEEAIAIVRNREGL